MQQKSESGWWRRVEGGWEDDGVSLPEQVGEEEKTRRQLERGGNQAANGIAEGGRRQGGQAASYPTSGTKYNALPRINPPGRANKGIGEGKEGR